MEKCQRITRYLCLVIYIYGVSLTIDTYDVITCPTSVRITDTLPPSVPLRPFSGCHGNDGMHFRGARFDGLPVDGDGG
jgi:hypothetical protein